MPGLEQLLEMLRRMKMKEMGYPMGLGAPIYNDSGNRPPVWSDNIRPFQENSGTLDRPDALANIFNRRGQPNDPAFAKGRWSLDNMPNGSPENSLSNIVEPGGQWDMYKNSTGWRM